MTTSFPLSRKKKPVAKPVKRRPERPVRQERPERPGGALRSGRPDLTENPGEDQTRFEEAVLKVARRIGIPLTDEAKAKAEPDAVQIILESGPGQRHQSGKHPGFFMRLFGPVLRVVGILLLLSFAASVVVQFIQGYLDDQALQEQAQTEVSPSGATGPGPSPSDDEYRNLDR